MDSKVENEKITEENVKPKSSLIEEEVVCEKQASSKKEPKFVDEVKSPVLEHL